VNLSLILVKNEKVEHYISIKIYKFIVLGFELRVLSMFYVIEFKCESKFYIGHR